MNKHIVKHIVNSQRERDGGGLGGAPGTRLRDTGRMDSERKASPKLLLFDTSAPTGKKVGFFWS
jgi:hypothetical protein